MKISVCVHNKDRADVLARCLDSVLAQEHRPLEAVILDAGSTDDSLAVIEEWRGRALAAGLEVVVRSVPMAGVPASRNMAAAAASGELLVFIDNDAEFAESQALSRTARAFAGDPKLGVLSFRILRGFSDEIDPASWVFRRPVLRWRDTEFATFTFAGTGFCVRAEPYARAGGFWERIGYAREEEELGLALIDMGYSLRYFPSVAVRHHFDPRGRADWSRRRFLELQNGLLIYARRLPILAAVLLCGMRVASMSLRLLLRREGRLRDLLAALPAAHRLWYDPPGPDRRPVSWNAFSRCISLNLDRSEFRVAETDAFTPRRIDILGAPLDCISFEEMCERIRHAALTGRRLRIAPSSIDFVMKARRDRAFRQELWDTELVIADGVPLTWAARLLGTPAKGRVSGTDMVWHMARLSAESGFGIAMIGGRHEITAKAAEVMRQAFPGARLHPLETPFPLTPEANRELTASIRELDCAVVLCALGAPRQERWIRDNLEACGCSVGSGIGSAFDIISGDKPRAPAWMRDNGLEWLHRLCQEPRRLFRRYVIEDMPFVLLLAGEILRRRLCG